MAPQPFLIQDRDTGVTGFTHSPLPALAQPNRVNSAARVDVDIQGNVLYSSGSLQNEGKRVSFVMGRL